MLVECFEGEFDAQVICNITKKIFVGKMQNSLTLDKCYLHSALIFNNLDNQKPPLQQMGYLSYNQLTGYYENTWIGQMSKKFNISFYKGKAESNQLILYRYKKNQPDVKNITAIIGDDEFRSQIYDVNSSQETLRLEAIFTRSI